MTLILRQVSRRSGGGEIVRTVALPGTEALIGRDGDCEIHLPDLSLGLRHARLTEIAPGRLLIEGLEKQKFVVNGRTRRRVEIETTTAPRLGFGAYDLTISAGETQDETVIGVAEREPEHEVDERASFSPPRGRRRIAWIASLLILGLCLALPIGLFHAGLSGKIPADKQWSGGHLSAAHAFLENDCAACHIKAFKAVADTACLSCHAADLANDANRRLAGDLRARGSPFDALPSAEHAVHARLVKAMPVRDEGWAGRIEAAFRRTFGRPQDRCVSCHEEHQEKSLAARPQDGSVKPASLPLLKPAATCQGCHSTLSRALPDTRLANVRDWGDHPDFRPMVIIAPGAPPQMRRITFTPSARETNGLIFSHAQHLASGGSVARMAGQSGQYGSALVCADCHHASPDARSYLPVRMERDCAACHSLALSKAPSGVLPHGKPAGVVATLRAFYQAGGPPAEPVTRRAPGLIAELRAQVEKLRPRPSVAAQVSAAARAAFAPGGQCYGCHAVIAPSDGSLNYRIAPVSQNFRYVSFAGGFDHSLAAHRQTPQGAPSCASCHHAETSTQAADLLMPHIADCAACHGKTDQQTPQAASGDCVTCHSYHAPSLPERYVEGTRNVARTAPPGL